MKFNFIEPEITDIDKGKYQPASYIRKSIEVTKTVKNATLYMTALGVYKGYFNGRELDGQLLCPGFTNYKSRLEYQQYNLTDRIRIGENVIAAVLGDGWYRGAQGNNNERNYYGHKIKFAALLVLEYENCIEEVYTDVDWKATQNGPVRVNDIKTYEIVDRQMDMPGWNDIGFDDSAWHGCVESCYTGKMIPKEGEKLLEHEHFKAKVLHTPDGNTILDFQQNLAGHVEFTVTGHAGTTVTLSMGETLDENGNFTIKNLKTKELGQKLTYTLKEGTQSYKSLFLISGFRYVRLENWPEEVKPDNFTSIAVYSDLKPAGEFSCSNEAINQLVHNVKWSQKSNFVEIPTDCPQRERAGWTGDINVFSETANYLTDAKRFLYRWLHDFTTMQEENGSLAYIVPGAGLGKVCYSSAGWSDAIANIPMILYQFYGEKEILEDVYDTVKRYVDFNLERAKKRKPYHFLKRGGHYKYILDTGYHFGEWLEPGKDMVKEGFKAVLFPDSEVATAWFYQTTSQLSQMAGILGKHNDETEYGELSGKIREAYRIEFLKNGKVNSNRQCRYVRPVFMGLVEDNEAKEIVADLNKMCIENNYKIGTGFLTTYKLLQVLCDFGFPETAYRILENEQCPGWLYEVKKGATTTWENWLGIDEKGVPKDSQNHYAPGSVAAWLFSHCGGIKPLEPGFGRIQIRPYPGGTLNWVNVSYESCKGRIVSKWRITGNQFELHIEVPEGIDTEVILPDGALKQVAGGMHEFNCKVS